MPPSCPHGDKPDMSLPRLVLIGEILCADKTRLALLADVGQQSGLLVLAEEPLPATLAPPGTLHRLRPSGGK